MASRVSVQAALGDLDALLGGRQLKVCKPMSSSITLADHNAPATDPTQQCSASGLTWYGKEFWDGRVLAQQQTASLWDCCRLCASTKGCHAWDFLEFSYGYDCSLYTLSHTGDTLHLFNNNKKRAGFLTNDQGIAAVSLDCGGPVWLMKGVALSGGDTFNSPGFFGSDFLKARKVSGWQECCRIARQKDADAWSMDSDKTCVLKRLCPWNSCDVLVLKRNPSAMSGFMKMS